ncbi:MAG: acetyltransferase [Porphyromonas sp.]|nr:acetyltransferase [Porphyromonas sp.]
MKKDIVIVGAGGLGREVYSMLQLLIERGANYSFRGFVDDGMPKGCLVYNQLILGGIDVVNEWNGPLAVVFGIGDPQTKRKIFQRIVNPQVEYPTLIHPSVIIQSPDTVSIGRGCVICAGAIITVDVSIEDFSLINLSCTVGHDARVGSFVSIMPSANISGETMIGEAVYIGTGARVINQKNIEKGATIGAGAVVVKDVPEKAVVAGVPAKVIRYKE